MRKFEPERVRRLNYDYAANASTGDNIARSEDELAAAAKIEAAAQNAYLTTPPGRFLAAIAGLQLLAEEIARLTEASRSAVARGWDKNGAFAHGLALELERTTARALALAAIAANAST